MKRVKLFEEFIEDSRRELNNDINEFNFVNLFGKFKKFIKVGKSDGDEEFLDDIEIINPETKKTIQLSSALKYDEDSAVRKIADAALKELKDNIVDSKHITPDHKSKYLFNKELKQQKAQSEEWGEEWTEKDTTRVKAETDVKVYNTLEGEKKNDFLKTILKDPNDVVLSNVSKWVDNDGAEIAYKSISNVDDYLNDDSGKGQSVTQIVLRSSSANDKQRQKSLMYDWVASPSSAGSLMMADHMIKKLKMSKETQAGFKHRTDNGETFAQKPGGNLISDVEKQNIKAVEDIYNRTQDYYKQKGIKTVKVYRGSDSKDPDEFKNPIESWTTDKNVALQYGQYVHSKEIPVERVMMGHFDKDFPDPMDYAGNPSKEIVILGE